MSVKVTSLVWKYGPKGPKKHAQFIALLTLAEFADAAGTCYPGIELIAARSRSSKRNTIRAVKELEVGAWISIDRKSRERKGNTYRIALERLVSGAEESPDKGAESGDDMAPDNDNSDGDSMSLDFEHSDDTVSPETQKVRCQMRQSQVPNRSKSGAKSAKPPDPLKGRTVINRQEPSLPPSNDLVLTSNKDKPKHQSEADPRHAPILRFLWEIYRERNLANCPDIRKCAGVLAQFLKNIDWSTAEICACITNRFDSDRPPPSQSPHAWISMLATWRNGALDTYGNLKLTGANRNGNGKRSFNRADANLDSAIAGGQAALASLSLDDYSLDEIGSDHGRANGFGRGPVTADGRGSRRLTAGEH